MPVDGIRIVVVSRKLLDHDHRVPDGGGDRLRTDSEYGLDGMFCEVCQVTGGVHVAEVECAHEIGGRQYAGHVWFRKVHAEGNKIYCYL